MLTTCFKNIIPFKQSADMRYFVSYGVKQKGYAPNFWKKLMENLSLSSSYFNTDKSNVGVFREIIIS